MSIRTFAAVLALGLAACAPQPALQPSKAPGAATAPLRLASWNLEFLAERDHRGCRPRSAADYAEMRRIADGLDADVIAFQEAENAAAAARVFDPARYTIVMESRPGKVEGNCGGRVANQPFIRQAVGFAVRKGLAFDRAADVTDLQAGNPNLRSGVDITIRPAKGQAIRLLAIHLKSGCFGDASSNPSCEILARQIPILERWVDAAAAGATRFAVLGDWNRRLALAGDSVWRDLDDADPANADLSLADAQTPPRCDPRYTSFIDHIVLDRRAARDFRSFDEVRYATASHFSDHCPIVATIAR